MIMDLFIIKLRRTKGLVQMKWYSDKFRRHLLDMHIDDWNEKFLSEFSPEVYVENLKKAKIQMAMIYLQSHIGICNWPTKTGKMHSHFKDKPDEIRHLIDLCHENNIKVMGYYSLNFNQYEHDRHKDWHMVRENGLSYRDEKPNDRSGICCPNNMEYREFVFRQIDEILEYFPVDGMFFDMLYWSNVCYCSSCEARHLKEKGTSIPRKDNCTPNEWIELSDTMAYWMGDWANAVTDYIHSKKPDMPVEHNLSAAIPGLFSGCRDYVNEACEYAGGDLYGGPLSQSFCCKFYRSISKNQPFEYMTGRCDPNLAMHTVTKSEDKLMQQVMITAAHHGAFLAIDAIDPVGTMDARVYETLGKVFEEEKVYEPYLKGDLIEDIGIFFNQESSINLQNAAGDMQTFLHFGSTVQQLTNYTCSLNALKKLVASHLPVGITTKRHTDSWSKYRTIIAPNINRLSDETVDALIDYVNNGGTLYFNNCDEIRLFETLIGGTYKGHTEVTRPYIFPSVGNEDLIPGFDSKYPLPFNFSVPIVEGIEKEDILAYICLPYTTRNVPYCASFHSDPPGIPTEYPAIIEKKYGKGKVIWCAGSPELYDPKIYKTLLLNILKRLDSRPFTVESDANSNIELISFKDDNFIRISAVNLTDSDELFILPDFTVQVKSDSCIKNIKYLPDGEKIPFKLTDNGVSFKIKDLRIMKMVEIELEK